MTSASPTAAAGLNPAESPAAVVVRQLTHQYPATKPRGRAASQATPNARAAALDDLSLDIRQGEIFGVLGPNGGGKTTLFRILATMLRPTSGTVHIFGNDAVTSPEVVRRFLGVVFQHPSLDIKLTAAENLTHQGRLYGLSGDDLRGRVADALERVRLADRAQDRVEFFSGGMRRRVELAKALLHRPRLLLLDEPATGLDPAARVDVWAQLRRLRDEADVTVALTTHLMDEADRCDRLAIISRGKLAAIDTPARLKALIGNDVLALELAGDATPELARSLRDEIDRRFAPWPPGGEPRVKDATIHLERADGAAFVAQLASAFPGRLRRLSVGSPSLETAFLHLTGRSFGDSTDDEPPVRTSGH